MNNATNPSQVALDAHYGYIYNIVGPGGRVYVGKHKHTTGESWSDYTGSGLRLRDEQLFFEPGAFTDRNARIEHIERKPGTRLRSYRKYLSSFADNADDLTTNEARSIETLVRSGTPFYNLDEAEQYATTYEARTALMAFRLSFEPRAIEALPDELANLTVAFHTVNFDLQHAAIREAQRIRSQRSLFRRRPQRGLIF